MRKELLPEGFYMRSAMLEDASAINALIRAHEIDLQGEAHHSEVELLQEWQRLGFCIDTDAWVVLAPDVEEPGKRLIVGYQEIWNQSEHAILSGDGYVHPQYKGLGIGTAMLRQAEQRAWQHTKLSAPEHRIVIRNGINSENFAAAELLENEHYYPVQDFWHMGIKFSVFEKELRAGIQPIQRDNNFREII